MKSSTIGKAIAVVECLRVANRPLSLKEISELTGQNKSSLHHHVKTLKDLGYLQQDPETRRYDIGLNLVRAGQAYLQRLDIRERGHLYLEQLSKRLNQTVHLLILDGNEIVYVDKVDVNHQPGALKCSSFIGLRTDLYSTASGKVLLAHLEQGAQREIMAGLELQKLTEHTITDKSSLAEDLELTKDRGYGLDLQEHTLGLQCIAVPVLNANSQCIAAISVSCPTAVVSTAELETTVIEALRDTAQKISRAIGYI